MTNKEKWIEEKLDRTLEMKLDDIFSNIEEIKWEWERNHYDNETTLKRINCLVGFDVDKWIKETKQELEEDYADLDKLS